MPLTSSEARFPMIRPTLLGLTFTLLGCALGPGLPFAVLEPTLSTHFERPADRDAGGGWQRLNTDYQATFTQLELEVTALQLQESRASGPITFDPGSPPPGYTVCHNGHCDHVDGRLVPYEEVQAELSGGASGPRTVVTLPVGAVDALVAQQRELSCDPSCDLPLARISRVRATVSRVAFAGRVRDTRTPPRVEGEVRWRLAMPLDPPVALTGELALPADNDHPLRARVNFVAALTPALLDNVAWEAGSTAGGGYDLSTAANAAARTALLENLAGLRITAEVERR